MSTIATATASPETRALAAELNLLERFDRERRILGHDYGSGQRAAELSRRRRELANVYTREGVSGAWTTTDAELVAAFEKVGKPRLSRALHEDFRRGTKATERTIKAWRALEREYAHVAQRAEQSARSTFETIDPDTGAKVELETARYPELANELGKTDALHHAEAELEHFEVRSYPDGHGGLGVSLFAPTGFAGGGWAVVDKATGAEVFQHAWRRDALAKALELDREAKAEQHRAAAREADAKAAESFERCDTDGFVSQWAHGMNAQLERAKATIAENGGKAAFDVLVNADGNVVPSRVVSTRYGKRRVFDSLAGSVWGQAYPPLKGGRVSKSFTDAGLSWAQVEHPAIAVHEGSGRGLSGNVWVAVKPVCGECGGRVTIGQACRSCGFKTPCGRPLPSEPVNVYLDDEQSERGE